MYELVCMIKYYSSLCVVIDLFRLCDIVALIVKMRFVKIYFQSKETF